MVHYAPLELYPPVTNLLDILGGRHCPIFVFSTLNCNSANLYHNPSVVIKRYALPGKEFILTRLFKYFSFNVGILISLIKLKPDKILYYETSSSFPVYLYKKYFNPVVEIFIHSHEYYSPEWWNNTSMRLMKYYNQKEVNYLYPKASWISQTNNERLKMFLNDIGRTSMAKSYVFPNYPPAKWKISKTKADVSIPVKVVYAGTFGSMETLYIKECLDWVVSLNGLVMLDIYTFNVSDKVLKYIKTLNSNFIRLFGPVDYDQLPGVLKGYQVGLILYKGTTKNNIFNAPNKLFEYLMSGLDVWYPTLMEGCTPYNSEVLWPKVLNLDFSKLSQYDVRELIRKDSKAERKIDYSAEVAAEPLLEKLLG